MTREKNCDNCNIKTKTKVTDLDNIGWCAYRIGGKNYYFCSDLRCQTSARKKMIEDMLKK